MRRRLSPGAALLIALLVAVVPAATAAEPAPEGLEGTFALKGTNGYRLFGLIASTPKGGVMTLFVGKKGEEATYVAHGEVAKESVDFNFGALGKVDVAVQPTGKTETLNSKCDGSGNATTVPASDYVGTIEFHGEEGFTEAETTRTPVLQKPIFELGCAWSGYGETFGPGTPGARIKARRKQGPTLQLNQNHRGARVTYEAEIVEREGAMHVDRSVGGRLGAGALNFESSLGAAVFTGSGPFMGKATYASVNPPHGTHPGKGTWRGDLKVNFPGRAGVRLAGPGFSAGIIHATRSESRG
jgi:hypothetical protein